MPLTLSTKLPQIWEPGRTASSMLKRREKNRCVPLIEKNLSNSWTVKRRWCRGTCTTNTVQTISVMSKMEHLRGQHLSSIRSTKTLRCFNRDGLKKLNCFPFSYSKSPLIKGNKKFWVLACSSYLAFNIFAFRFNINKANNNKIPGGLWVQN